MATTGERLYEISTIDAVDTALNHFLNIDTGDVISSGNVIAEICTIQPYSVTYVNTEPEAIAYIEPEPLVCSYQTPAQFGIAYQKQSTYNITYVSDNLSMEYIQCK